MSESDFIVMFVGDIDKLGSVTDRYVDDQYSRPKMDNMQDTILLYANQTDEYSYMSVARKVKTNDKQDREIQDDDDQYLLWAIGSEDSFNIHHKKGWATINWRSGRVSQGDPLPLRWLHGMFMIFSWMLVSIISFGLCRYCKSLQGSSWLYVHLLLMLITVIFTILGFILIIISTSLDNHSHFNSYHSIAGLIIVICTVVQPLIISIFKLPPGSLFIKPGVTLMIALAQHRYFGYLMILFAIVNIGTGLDLYRANTGLWVCFGVWLGLSILYWFIHEILSVVPGFNEVVGKIGGPKNIFKDFYAFILFSLQLLYFTISAIIFVTMIVLFAVYEDSIAEGNTSQEYN